MKINSKSIVKAHLLLFSLISMVFMNCSGPSKEAGIKLEEDSRIRQRVPNRVSGGIG